MYRNKIKYEITDEIKKCCGKTLYRIRAITEFADVKAGDLGGFIEGTHNLCKYGVCWVYDGCVLDRGFVGGCAQVRGTSVIRDNAEVSGNAKIVNSTLEHAALVDGDAELNGAIIRAHAWIAGGSLGEGAIVYGGGARIKGLGGKSFESI